jgi:hypothetical protein
MSRVDVTTELLKKYAQISQATELLLSKTRDWNVVKQYMCNRVEEVQLTEEQQRKLERYQFIYNQLISNRYTEQQVVTQCKRFYGLSISQAYEDLKGARDLFACVVHVNKRFELQSELQSAKQLKLKCIELGDMKTAAAFQKNIIAILSLLPDVEENPAELFEGITIEPVFNPSL